jgi:hypothetical protein
VLIDNNGPGVIVTFVKKSLQPAASASLRSLCRELAVRATIMTGLLNRARLASLSDCGSRPTPMESLGVDANTPMELTRSRRRISRVASRPDMSGN